MRKLTGFKDSEGNDIHVGDVVEWYWDEYLGYSDVPDDKYTRMRDLVTEINGTIYFTCKLGSAFIWRHVDHCKVIGTDPALVDT